MYSHVLKSLFQCMRQTNNKYGIAVYYYLLLIFATIDNTEYSIFYFLNNCCLSKV